MGSIREWGEKIKVWLDGSAADWALPIIVFLVALGSFGLGRLSAIEGVRPVVFITQAAAEAVPRGMYIGGEIVASRSGSVYYFPWCAGVSKIASQNQVWFVTEAAAQKAGLAPAKNCKGLAPAQ